MEDDRKSILGELRARLCAEFGEDVCRGVFHALGSHGAGKRISVPSVQDLNKWQRDARIRASFDGTNAGDVAACFGLSAKQIRRIAVGRCPLPDEVLLAMASRRKPRP